jgi:hypothetical protein
MSLQQYSVILCWQLEIDWEKQPTGQIRALVLEVQWLSIDQHTTHCEFSSCAWTSCPGAMPSKKIVFIAK